MEEETIKTFKAITAKSELTEKDALTLGRKINKAVHKRYKREHLSAY